MIRVLLLDLEETLVHDLTPFPGVPEALDLLAGFECAGGEPLEMALVSDYRMPRTPGDAGEIARLFEAYLGLLERTGLRAYFEPVERRVTLSAHAGVTKPDRRVFERALARLGVDARLEECLIVTGNDAHVTACRALGMAALHFGERDALAPRFDEWTEAPLLVARLVDAPGGADLEAALALRAARAFGVEDLSITEARADGTVLGRARAWLPVPEDGADAGDALCLPLPVGVRLALDGDGHLRGCHRDAPDPADVDEARQLVRTLQANRQIAGSPEAPEPGTTHAVEIDRAGRRRLVRKRFSAR